MCIRDSIKGAFSIHEDTIFGSTRESIVAWDRNELSKIGALQRQTGLRHVHGRVYSRDSQYFVASFDGRVELTFLAKLPSSSAFVFECPAIKEFFYRLPGKPIRRLSTNQEIATLDGNISLSRCGQFVKGPRKYLDLATGKEHYGWNAESGTIARIPMVNENYLKKIKRVAIDSNRIILETRRGVYFEFRYVCLLYTSPSPRDRTRSRMPSSA